MKFPFFITTLLVFQSIFGSEERVREILKDYAVSDVLLLSGGYSGASNYRIGNEYVLRMYDLSYPVEHVMREFHAAQMAAQEGIGPCVESIFLADRAMLMEYVPVKTISIDQAYQSLDLMAETLRKAHATEKNPYPREPLFDQLEKIYDQILPTIVDEHTFKEAMSVIRQSREKLENSQFERVNTHGDLNPRNVFLTDDGIKLIDWSETYWDHPFYDLSCFAMMHNYSVDSESAFLKSYLMREPTDEENRQYKLVKKINFAIFSFSCSAIARGLQEKNPQVIDLNTPLKDLDFYLDTFSKGEELSAQFFSECARGLLAECKDQ